MLVFRNLWRHRLRTVMTGMGVAAGVALFVCLFAISRGLKGEIETLISANRVDVVVQSKSAATPTYSRLTPDDISGLGSLPQVRQVISVVMGAIKTPWSAYQVVIGVSDLAPLEGRITLTAGTLPAQGSEAVLLGCRLAQSAGHGPGDKIMLDSNTLCSVAGVYATGARLLDGAVVMTLEDARRRLGRDRTVNMALLQLRPQVDVATALHAISERYPHLSGVRSGEFTGQLRLMKVINAAASAISIVGFVSSCLVVMNTMLMAVTERVREIGVLLAVGWSRLRIVRMVVAESLALSVFAGVAGIGLAWVLLRILSWCNPESLGIWLSGGIPWRICVDALAAAAVLGVVGAGYPAWMASRLRPSDCLRYEFV